MEIKTHRGHNETVGTLVEISTAKTRILLDTGVNLDDRITMQQDSSLFDGKRFDAVFITHYHTDHVGLSGELFAEAPVYIGEMESRIITASDEYKAQKPYPFTQFYKSGTAISVGDITVTLFLVDQPAYDAYMLLIENDDKRILYTGDYRSNGRKSFEEMLVNLPPRVDVLICDGKGITREDINPITERDLEEKAVEMIAKKTGPVFVLQDVTHFDRITTMFHAAQRCKRLFLQPLYLSQITSAMGNKIANPDDFLGVQAFLTTGYQPEHYRYQLFKTHNRIGKSEIVKQKFVMCVTPSMKKYLKSLSQMMNFHNGVLIDSYQGDAPQSPEAEALLKFAQDKGLEVVSLRTSGHADAMALKALVNTVHPTKIVPLNQENTQWFYNEFSATVVVKEDVIHC